MNKQAAEKALELLELLDDLASSKDSAVFTENFSILPGVPSFDQVYKALHWQRFNLVRAAK